MMNLTRCLKIFFAFGITKAGNYRDIKIAVQSSSFLHGTPDWFQPSTEYPELHYDYAKLRSSRKTLQRSAQNPSWGRNGTRTLPIRRCPKLTVEGKHEAIACDQSSCVKLCAPKYQPIGKEVKTTCLKSKRVKPAWSHKLTSCATCEQFELLDPNLNLFCDVDSATNQHICSLSCFQGSLKEQSTKEIKCRCENEKCHWKDSSGRNFNTENTKDICAVNSERRTKCLESRRKCYTLPVENFDRQFTIKNSLACPNCIRISADLKLRTSNRNHGDGAFTFQFSDNNLHKIIRYDSANIKDLKIDLQGSLTGSIRSNPARGRLRVEAVLELQAESTKKVQSIKTTICTC